MSKPNPKLGFIFRIIGFVGALAISTGYGLFLSVADNSLGKSGSLALPPTVLASGFLLIIVSVMLFRDFLSGNAGLTVGMLLRSNIPVVFVFAFLAFLSLVQAFNSDAYWGESMKWIFLQTYDFIIFTLAMLVLGLEFMRKYIRFFIFVGLCTILWSIFYEVEYPGTWSTVPNRAAGFPGNSNWGALITVMNCSMCLGYREGRSRLLDMLIFAITGTGLYFTLSRSGLINFTMLIGFYTLIAVISSRNRMKTMVTIGSAVFVLITFFVMAIPFLSQNTTLMSQSNAQERVLGLLSGEIVDDGSAAERLEAARDTLNHIEERAILGHGTGYNRKLTMTPHNLYLKLWVDSGVVGLMTWLSLLGCSFWLFTARKYRPGQALILVTTLGGFFSHNILEQRTFLILLGSACALSLYQSANYLVRNSAFSLHRGVKQISQQVADPV